MTEVLPITEFPVEPGPVEIPTGNGAYLRQMNMADAQRLLALFKANKRRLTKAHMYVPRKIEDIEERIRRHEKHGTWDFGIWADDKLVGEIGLQAFPHNPGMGEVFYLVDGDHTGQGLATEALRAVSDFAFDELGFKSLKGVVNANNRDAERSRRVLAKAGFRLLDDGPAHSYVYFRGANSPRSS